MQSINIRRSSQCCFVPRRSFEADRDATSIVCDKTFLSFGP